MDAQRLRYKRLILKISGEAVGPDGGAPANAVPGLDMARVARAAREVKAVKDAGGEIGIVIGGGNFIRGRKLRQEGIDEVTADTMGMLCTVINGLALREGLERLGVEARLMTAIPMPAVAEPYCREQCLRHLARGRAVVLAAGTGNPHFTTDSGAALRARELNADAVLKATTVDGVYSADPKKDPQAKRFARLSYADFIGGNLAAMDIAAVALCREGRIPVVVFDLGVDGNVLRAACGERIGTLVEGE